MTDSEGAFYPSQPPLVMEYVTQKRAVRKTLLPFAMRVAVIGGGPSGLVTLKYLLSAHDFFPVEPIEARLFEAESSIGGTFRYRDYEDAELVSSRQLTLFSDFRIHDSEADFVSTKRYCRYLEEYCEQFNLWPHIILSTRIVSVRRRKDGGHAVNFQCRGDEESKIWTCDAVAVCSGLHVTPNMPSIVGIENVSFKMHSSCFKSREQFGIGKNILILGSGETGMDLSYLAITSPTKSVVLCHRSGWQNTPKRFPDPVIQNDVETWKVNQIVSAMPPTDTSTASLFDTAYVHPLLEKSMLLWDYYDLFSKWSLWLISGTHAGLDQWVGGIAPERFHASRIIPNKSNNATPYISAPYRPKTKSRRHQKISQYVYIPTVDTRDRHIDLAPWPEYVDKEGVVHFQDNGRPEAQTFKETGYRPDVVIFATGYTQIFPFLDGTYPRPQEADVRRIWKRGDESVAFVGFVRPNFGAIPVLAEMQAQLWIQSLLRRLPRPLQYEDSFQLKMPKDRRLQYIVDHESYVYQLALDMGSAPSIFQVSLFGWKVLATWALGVNFNTKFRLVGPWKWEGAAPLMRTELWRTIQRRRGRFLWMTLTVIPIILFGTLSSILFIVCGIWDLLAWTPRKVGGILGHRTMVRRKEG